ncbi:MAG: CorA family divalent cation transporter, partial [Syntrophaceae bacterium]
LSSSSNRLNEVMKMLTIIATVFMPLTFLAGVYGMNFEHMPELKWYYGYFMLWGVMIAMAVTMLAYFRRRKWI